LIKKLLLIPDAQVKPGVPLDHLVKLGEEILEERPDVIYNIGDWFDMPSLSSYDRGTAKAEQRRVMDDIAAGNLGMQLLLGPLRALQDKQRRSGKKVYKPRMYFSMGNHEDRIRKYENTHPELQGALAADRLDLRGWEVIPFLQVKELEGVSFSHYFYNPNTGRPYSGTMEFRLGKLKRSFVQGHEQGLKYATEAVGDGRIHGLMAGSFYLHDEDYKGPQGNNHWRGHCYLHNINNGSFDLDIRSL
jgi:hypothetical protein